MESTSRSEMFADAARIWAGIVCRRLEHFYPRIARILPTRVHDEPFYFMAFRSFPGFNSCGFQENPVSIFRIEAGTRFGILLSTGWLVLRVPLAGWAILGRGDTTNNGVTLRRDDGKGRNSHLPGSTALWAGFAGIPGRWRGRPFAASLAGWADHECIHDLESKPGGV